MLLALDVLASHTRFSTILNINWLNSVTAVEIFFVISGFFIQMQILNLNNGATAKWQWKFFSARLFRIFPAYWVCLIISFVYYFFVSTPAVRINSEFPLYPNEAIESLFALKPAIENLLLQIWWCVTTPFAILQDLALLWYVDDGVAFLSMSLHNTEFYIPQSLLVPQAWSLGIELTFYLLAPFLLQLRSGYLFIISGVFLIMKVYLSISGMPESLGWRGDLIYRFFPLELPYFIGGAIVYRYKERLNIFSGKSYQDGKLMQLLVAYFLVWVATMGLGIPNQSFDYSIAITLGCMLILPSLYFITINNKADRYVGDLTYPIYIFHIIIYAICCENWERFAFLVKDYPSVGHVEFYSFLTLLLTISFSIFYVSFERGTLALIRGSKAYPQERLFSIRVVQLIFAYLIIWSILLFLRIPAEKFDFKRLALLAWTFILPCLFFMTLNKRTEKFVGLSIYPLFILHITIYAVCCSQWEKLAFLVRDYPSIGHSEFIFYLTIGFTIVFSSIYIAILHKIFSRDEC